MKKIVILTGAGISAESGIKTFRDSDGLWENHAIEDVATPEGFMHNPQLVYKFYNQRRRQAKETSPNKAHLALAQLAEIYGDNLTLITQNVDDLHERSGQKNIYHMHGELNKARCTNCSHIAPWLHDLDENATCPQCQKLGHMRPHIVWFGEMPLYMDFIEEKLKECDIFCAIGTSAQVYPAAGFVEMVNHFKPQAQTIEINLEASNQASRFKQTIYGKATECVPDWCKNLAF